MGRGPSVNEIQPNPIPSKITHTLISHELSELRNQVQKMQRDKNDLEQRLQDYEFQRARQGY